MPFVLLLVLATRFDGKSIDRRANPNYTLIQMGRHTRLCALLYNEEDFINRFGNPEACLVEIRPEAPSLQIAGVFSVIKWAGGSGTRRKYLKSLTLSFPIRQGPEW